MGIRNIDTETLRTYLRDPETQSQYTREQIENELHRRNESDIRFGKYLIIKGRSYHKKKSKE